MRLITKINTFFGAILIFLMALVFLFTRFFIQKEFQAQVEQALQVTSQSLRLTLENIDITQQQQASAIIQTRGDTLGIATRDRLSSVLYYYLSRTATNYNLKLIEIIDTNCYLLSDNRRVYPANTVKLKFPLKKTGVRQFYLSKRGPNLYLMTSIPLLFEHKPVGYMNLGTLVTPTLMNYFSSVIHSKILFYFDNRLVIANTGPVKLPAGVWISLRMSPEQPVFVPGNKLHNKKYDYLFMTMASDSDSNVIRGALDSARGASDSPSGVSDSIGGAADAVVGIAYSRSEVEAALIRLQVFLWALTGFGIVFGSIGTNMLARNIKRLIFGMEPTEIASLLEQRTTILESTFEGIIALDQEGIITLVNKEAKQILPPDLEFIGQPAENLFQDSTIKAVLTTGQAVYNQRQLIGETIIVYNCVPIKTKNRIHGAVITLRDLTEFQKVAEELVEVKNYTQALRSQSHEFSNKLQSISGLIQLGKYETALTLLHETSESHQDLITLLNNAFAASAVSGILLGKYNRAKELNIDFIIDAGSSIPKGVLIPDNELVCIVGNLIENAFEALRESPQKEKKVWVKIYPRRQNLVIAVADNGPGIPAAISKRIFERGFTTKKGSNKGIGLNLVKRSVENLRGVIKVSNRTDTVFIAVIPLKNGGA